MQEATLPRPEGKRIDQPRPKRDTNRKSVGDGIYTRNGKFYFKDRGKWVEAVDQFGIPARNKTEALRYKKTNQGVEPEKRQMYSTMTFGELAEKFFAQPPADNKASTCVTERRRYDLYMCKRPASSKQIPGLEGIAHLKVQKIGKNDLIDLMIWPMRQAGLAPLTITNVIATAAKIFNTAVNNEPQLIPASPTRRLRAGTDYERGLRRKVVRILEPDELEALFTKGGSGKAPASLVAFALGAFAGLRGSEICGLQWENVLWDEGQLDIRFQHDRDAGTLMPPKTLASIGRVDMAPGLRKMLKAQLEREFAKGRGKEGYVLMTWGDKPYRLSTLTEMLDKACKRAGIAEPWPTPHDLRHTFASILIAEWGKGELDLATISRQLRHKTPAETLKTYASEFDKYKSKGKAGAALDAQMAWA